MTRTCCTTRPVRSAASRNAAQVSRAPTEDFCALGRARQAGSCTARETSCPCCRVWLRLAHCDAPSAAARLVAARATRDANAVCRSASALIVLQLMPQCLDLLERPAVSAHRPLGGRSTAHCNGRRFACLERGSVSRLFSCAMSNMSFSLTASFFFISVTCDAPRAAAGRCHCQRQARV